MVALKAEEKFMLLVDDFDRFNVKNAPAFDYHDGDDFHDMMTMIIMMAYVDVKDVVATWKRRSRPNALVKASAPRRSASTWHYFEVSTMICHKNVSMR